MPSAGRALEQIPEPARNPRIPELAWHYLEADDPEPALRWALRAGRGGAISLPTTKPTPLPTALELARELKDVKAETRSLEEIARVLRTVARYDDALEAYESAVTLHRRAKTWPGSGGQRRRSAVCTRFEDQPSWASKGSKNWFPAIEATRPDNGIDDSENLPNGMAALYTALADLYQVTGRAAPSSRRPIKRW